MQPFACRRGRTDRGYGTAPPARGYSEPELKTLTATLDQAAGHYGAVILGGHTEVVPGLVKLVITVTAVGKAKSLPLKTEPELDLVVAGTIAGSAAARLAADQREQLLECFPKGS